MNRTSTSSHLTAEEVVQMLDSDGEDYDMDEIIFPGSDDELGFEEIEIEEEIGDDSDNELLQGRDNRELDSEDEIAQGGEGRDNIR